MLSFAVLAHIAKGQRLDPLITYLIVINIVTAVAFVVDFLLCLRFPKLEDSAANSLIMDAFPIAGGAFGMLLALFVLTGLVGGHRMNKENVAWWFLAIVCAVVWGIIACARLGLVSPNASIDGLTTGWDLDKLRVLGIYLLVINVVTFVAFVHDKHVAEQGNDPRSRVPESVLLGLCLAGGSAGGMLAMHVVRHKTRRWYFRWGLPVFIVLHVALMLFAHQCGAI